MGWKLNNDRQIWMQLVEVLRMRIVTGRYPAGERMPSVRERAAEAGVNPNTMQRWRNPCLSAPCAVPAALSRRTKH